MIEQIGTVLPGAPAERERTPVRRQSRARGRCEGVFWRRTNRQDVRTIVLAARRYELAGRQPGARNGPLGGVAIELLELFANLVDFRTGRLEPSIDTLTAHLALYIGGGYLDLRSWVASGLLDLRSRKGAAE